MLLQGLALHIQIHSAGKCPQAQAVVGHEGPMSGQTSAASQPDKIIELFFGGQSDDGDSGGDRDALAIGNSLCLCPRVH